MRALLLICSGLLLLAIAELPSGYYTFLRIAVFIATLIVIVAEFKNGISFRVIAFGIIAIVFNPLIPVYLNDKETWIPIDIISAVFFGVKSFIGNKNNN